MLMSAPHSVVALAEEEAGGKGGTMGLGVSEVKSMVVFEEGDCEGEKKEAMVTFFFFPVEKDLAVEGFRLRLFITEFREIDR